MTSAAEAENVLQRMINEASPGDVIKVPAGEYSGPIVIDKPLTVQSNGAATIRGNQVDPVITVLSEQVTLDGLKIIHQSPDKDTRAILVEGNHHNLNNLTIRTDGYGIVLRDAHQSRITENTITGNADRPVSERQNGIDLFGSHDNVIANNDIIYVHDGVYMERSEDNKVTQNHVTNSRYGFHLMFTEGTILSQNQSEQNVTGAMVMGTRETSVRDNQFSEQLNHVYAQGLLLYDVQNAEVHHNVINANLVGMLIQDSKENRIYQNHVAANFIGVQLLNAEHNDIFENNFVANVVSGQAQHSAFNRVQGNYWDSHMGLDLDGDDHSEMAFRADPFFYTIVKDKPAFQIFFQAPGMVFMENLLKSDTNLWMTDTAPLIEPVTESEVENRSSSLLFIGFSVLLLLYSFYFIYFGGIRKYET